MSNIINIHAWYRNGQLEALRAEQVIRAFQDKKIFYFKKTYKINAIRGFWEVEYWTRDIIKLDEQILISDNNSHLRGKTMRNAGKINGGVVGIGGLAVNERVPIVNQTVKQ